MSTAYLFAGLNSLMNAEARGRYLGLPRVQARLRQAEAALKRELDLEIDLDSLLGARAEELYSIRNVSLAAVAVCAIQVGAFEELQATGRAPRPDWVMGCSLGDIARAVVAGAYEFDTAVVSHVRFTHGIDGIDALGANIGVSALRGFTSEDYSWFESEGVDVSRLTPRFLNIGGLTSALMRVQARAREKRWRVIPILNYPAHSRYLLPFVRQVETQFEKVGTAKPTLPIFSSLSCRVLEDPADIRREFLLAITLPIHWSDAVSRLVADHGVKRFVNVGPCSSLSKLMSDVPAAEGAEIVDAWSLLD